MTRSQSHKAPAPPVVLTFGALVSFLLVVVMLIPGEVAHASPSSRLESTQAKLEKAQEREGVLTTTLAQYSAEIDDLEGQLAELRGRETEASEELATKQIELDRATAELDKAKRKLANARGHLKRALIVLRQRLIAIYESGSPDIVSLVLSSVDYSDLAASSSYLSAIQSQDESVAARVGELRDEAESTVRQLRLIEERIEAARNEIAAEEQRLAQARSSLEVRQGKLVAVRAQQQHALGRIKLEADHFSANIEAIQQQIAEEITQASGSVPVPAGPPAPGAGSSGLIWPVEGVITSGFGPRWGSFHPGLDIGAAEGTPIWAAASGTVVLMQSEAESGGYGNYTCIDHGGGLSTCYAHQTSFATSLGASVEQGQVVGYVGNTGFSTGPHLHFEVRINGEPQDPLGYL